MVLSAAVSICEGIVVIVVITVFMFMTVVVIGILDAIGVAVSRFFEMTGSSSELGGALSH